MADVAVLAKVFPEDAEKVEELKQEIEKTLKPNKVAYEDIGFGVRILKVTLVVSDDKGGDVEEQIKKVKGVSEVQIESVDRL